MEIADSKRAYLDGLQDGQRDWSCGNSWAFSKHMDSYCKGFSDGSAIRDKRLTRK